MCVVLWYDTSERLSSAQYRSKNMTTKREGCRYSRRLPPVENSNRYVVVVVVWCAVSYH